MTNANMTIENKQPTTAEQYAFLCGVLLPQIQAIYGCDRKTAHKRMRDRLIEWGYIKRSRSELTYHQTIEITERYKNFLAEQQKKGGRRTLSADKEHEPYAESGIRKTL